MNHLFPIIRRKRRPLLLVESLHDLPPVTKNDTEPKKQVTPNLPEKLAGKLGKKAKPTDVEAT